MPFVVKEHEAEFVFAEYKVRKVVPLLTSEEDLFLVLTE